MFAVLSAGVYFSLVGNSDLHCRGRCRFNSCPRPIRATWQMQIWCLVVFMLWCFLFVADLIVGMAELELHYRCGGRSNFRRIYERRVKCLFSHSFCTVFYLAFLPEMPGKILFLSGLFFCDLFLENFRERTSVSRSRFVLCMFWCLLAIVSAQMFSAFLPETPGKNSLVVRSGFLRRFSGKFSGANFCFKVSICALHVLVPSSHGFCTVFRLFSRKSFSPNLGTDASLLDQGPACRLSSFVEGWPWKSRVLLNWVVLCAQGALRQGSSLRIAGADLVG